MPYDANADVVSLLEAFSADDVKQAIALYRQALKAMKDDKKAFTEQFENDYNQLQAIGVNPEDLPLIIDAVISTNN